VQGPGRPARHYRVELTHCIQAQGAAIAGLDQPFLLAYRVGERSAFWPNNSDCSSWPAIAAQLMSMNSASARLDCWCSRRRVAA